MAQQITEMLPLDISHEAFVASLRPRGMALLGPPNTPLPHAPTQTHTHTATHTQVVFHLSVVGGIQDLQTPLLWAGLGLLPMRSETEMKASRRAIAAVGWFKGDVCHPAAFVKAAVALDHRISAEVEVLHQPGPRKSERPVSKRAPPFVVRLRFT